ncbi:cation-translocating P-type ATPase [Roseateles cellulosilyticus]|uniref:Cation-translocating P-type ATPase n=1 Tax=Pelomonas cellulosilytica TaxID=2906762 RepID=A0ABS8XXT6_9BURK|nr:cation-translocating P-type ATPase [Pelomonas sp. P8]MCE4556748.1 cation-translocating P-type ATPase [Pelomonas sp. P8]
MNPNRPLAAGTDAPDHQAPHGPGPGLTTPASGLSQVEAAARLAAHGPNEMADHERQGFGATLRNVLTEPMFLMLLGAAGLYLVVGDLGEGLLLAFFAVVTVGLVIVQDRRSEHALDALRGLAAPQVRVLREGRAQRLPARELVPGDLMLLAEGERIAADGWVRETVGLGVDESLLTGESVPVRKHAAAVALDAPPAPGSEDTPMVYAGTLVVGGHALVEVVATGRGTQVGRIGASLADIETAPTPLQRHLQRLVRAFGVGTVLASGAIALGYGLIYGNWLQGLLSALALGMAMLPEEFPMVLTVFLALGAWRLARVQVLSRRPAVVEALGAATVLCVDKTGTLTENRMRLRRLVTDTADVTLEPDAPLPEAVHRLLEYAMLASRRGSTDPMDRALLGQGDAALADSEHLHPDWQLAHEFPLTAGLLAMSQDWTDAEGVHRVAAKGAPEAVFGLCHLPPERIAALQDRLRTLGEAGLRVLAVAEGTAPAGSTVSDPHELDFRLLGFVAFEDPLRPSVPPAVAQAREAGIAVAMITGDHAATALAIARQAGIPTEAGALTGADIAALDDAGLAAAVQRVRVFARVQPEQKLRLVEAFRRNGEVVAMTGDGVNDAPALKAAHIGIAMGVRGTDVAREAAGLVLLDEDFGRIVGGVRMGRRIFDNLRNVMVYITAIHVPVAGLALLPLLLGLPPLMLPAHVVLTEMVIDPVCSLAFEGAPEAPGLMQRPPRRSDAGIVGWPMLWQGLVQGLCLLGATLTIDVLALQAGHGEDVARTLAVVALTVGNLGLAAANALSGNGWRALAAPGSRMLWAVTAGASAVLALAVALPGARALLHFGLPAAGDLGLAMCGAVVAVALGVALSHRLRRGD